MMKHCLFINKVIRLCKQIVKEKAKNLHNIKDNYNNSHSSSNHNNNNSIIIFNKIKII